MRMEPRTPPSEAERDKLGPENFDPYRAPRVRSILRIVRPPETTCFVLLPF
jgi:hypothetical protein